MLDAGLRRQIDPVLNGWGAALAARGISANRMTLVGLACGLAAATLVALGASLLALLPLALSRLADGLDGAIARATRRTDFGGFLDIVSDFVFYGALPLGFVLADPATNGASGAFLIATFYVNGATFLGFAVLAEKRGIQTRAQGVKSLYYSAGLLEGTETIAFFVFICLWPEAFVPAAWVFGTLCLVTAAARVLLARRIFPPP